MKTINRIINQIDSSERELPGAAVHNVVLILSMRSEKASEKEHNSRTELPDAYLL